MRPLEPRKRKVFMLVLCLFILLTAAEIELDSRGQAERAGSRLDGLPPVMLWAWERPENLSFLDPAKTGVAFLLATVQWSGAGFEVRPRLQRLAVPPGTQVEAVVRIETDHENPTLFAPEECLRLAGEIVRLTEGVGVDRLQLDFDARRSEREGYRRLLQNLRMLWAGDRSLTMTALASWCLFDDWISDLPVDATLPMLFEMGPDRRQVLSRLRSKRPFPVSSARFNWGVSTQELEFDPPAGVRFYVFHPRAWSPAAFEEFEKWRNR